MLAVISSDGVVKMGGEKEVDIDEVMEKAVKKVFYVLGVDVDNPREVEEFRKDLRFSGSLRGMANKGAMVFWLGVVAAIAGALWLGIVAKIKGVSP